VANLVGNRGPGQAATDQRSKDFNGLCQSSTRDYVRSSSKRGGGVSNSGRSGSCLSMKQLVARSARTVLVSFVGSDTAVSCPVLPAKLVVVSSFVSGPVVA